MVEKDVMTTESGDAHDAPLREMIAEEIKVLAEKVKDESITDERRIKYVKRIRDNLEFIKEMTYNVDVDDEVIQELED